jgi:hypothetical protein
MAVIAEGRRHEELAFVPHRPQLVHEFLHRLDRGDLTVLSSNR